MMVSRIIYGKISVWKCKYVGGDIKTAKEICMKKKLLIVACMLLAAIGVFAQTQPDLSIDEYTRIIQANPDDVVAYMYRGRAYLDIGNVDKAIEDFSQRIRLVPNAPAYNERALAYNDKGDLNRAIADWETMLQLDPNAPDYVIDHFAAALFRRGIAYANNGDIVRGIADLEAALRVYPNANPVVRENLEIMRSYNAR